MKMLIVFLLSCLVIPFVASAQAAPAGPPDNLQICFDKGNCIFVARYESGYLGFNNGMAIGWRFNIDAWGQDRIALTGISEGTDASGKTEIMVVKGTPDVGTNGVAHAKARRITGGGPKSRKVTVTWDVPPSNLSGLWIR